MGRETCVGLHARQREDARRSEHPRSRSTRLHSTALRGVRVVQRELDKLTYSQSLRNLSQKKNLQVKDNYENTCKSTRSGQSDFREDASFALSLTQSARAPVVVVVAASSAEDGEKFGVASAARLVMPHVLSAPNENVSGDQVAEIPRQVVPGVNRAEQRDDHDVVHRARERVRARDVHRDDGTRHVDDFLRRAQPKDVARAGRRRWRGASRASGSAGSRRGGVERRQGWSRKASRCVGIETKP